MSCRESLAVLDEIHVPIHTREVDGAPILKIHRFSPGLEVDSGADLFSSGARARLAADRLHGWVGCSVARFEALSEIFRRPVPTPEKLAALRRILPADFDADLEATLAFDGR